MHGVARVGYNLATKPPPPGNSDKSDPRLVEVYDWNSNPCSSTPTYVKGAALWAGIRAPACPALRQELRWTHDRWPCWPGGSSHQQLEWRPSLYHWGRQSGSAASLQALCGWTPRFTGSPQTSEEHSRGAAGCSESDISWHMGVLGNQPSRKQKQNSPSVVYLFPQYKHSKFGQFQTTSGLRTDSHNSDY